MAKRQVISKRQKKFLESFSQSGLADKFYLSGGTALSYYYLQHRYSEDLDFFSQSEFKITAVNVWLKQKKSEIKYKTIDYQSSFNRNIFQIRFTKNEFLKVEFTFFPFKPVETAKKIEGILVDSLIDIAVNKLFTIHQQPRGRDYFDLYTILQKKSYTIKKLTSLAKAKFDWHVDPLQLGVNFFKVDKFLDDPLLIKKVDRRALVGFFKRESRNLKQGILD